MSKKLKFEIISYADGIFTKKQKRLTRSLKLIDISYKITEYSPKNIDDEFKEKYKYILDQPRGSGYWLWKPYFILKHLLKMNDGEYLFYIDSGTLVVNKLEKLIKSLELQNQEIMGFELPLIERQWTKKETITIMDCENTTYLDSNQILSSFILIKKTNKSINFFNDFLNYATDYKNITDYKSSLIMQDSSFIDHRHDQSIFSLLYKKYEFVTFRDPSQFGYLPEKYSGLERFTFEKNVIYSLSNSRLFRVNTFNNSKYPLIFLHIRKSRLFGAIFRIYFKLLLRLFKK
jgi:hypothetical protein